MEKVAKTKKRDEIIKTDGSEPLKSIMQEMFVSNILQGMLQREAYRKAGYKVSEKQLDSAASQLSTNIKTIKRIAYKRQKLAEKVNITVEGQTKRLQEISESAQKSEQNGAAVAAEREINTICGLRDAEGTTNVNVVTIADIFARTGCKRLSGPIIDAPALPSGDLTGDEGDNTQEGEDHGM